MTTAGGVPAAPCRGFPVFSLQSLRLIADQTGVQEISDDVLLLISEDMTYRVREMISNSIQFTRHSCRTKLAIDDVEKAFQFASVDIFGSACLLDRDPQYLHHTGIFCVPQEEADLITESEEVIEARNKMPGKEHCSPPSMHWLMIDGRIICNGSEESSPAQPVPKVSATLVTYYECLLKAILSDDHVDQSVALKDLSANDRIQPIVGHIVTALQTHVKSADFHLKSSSAIVNAFCKILTNPSLLTAHPSHLKTIQDTLLDMVLKPGKDCNRVRQRAAAGLSLLCDVCSSFPHIFDPNPKSHILSRLQEFVSSFTGSEDLSSMSGVLLTCLTCGSDESVSDYLAIVVKALQTVEHFKNGGQNMTADVQYMFPGVAGCLMSRLLRDYSASPDVSALAHYYQQFYEHFSDSLTCFLLLEDCVHNLPVEVMPVASVASLGWIEEKTGNDLLDGFYETKSEVAAVDGKSAGATNNSDEGTGMRSSSWSQESNDESVRRSRNSVTHAITACTIFDGYASLPRSRSISIVTSNRNSGGESDVAAAGITAAGHSPICSDETLRHTLPQLACRKEQQIRLQRGLRRRPQGTSHQSCSHVNAFL